MLCCADASAKIQMEQFTVEFIEPDILTTIMTLASVGLRRNSLPTSHAAFLLGSVQCTYFGGKMSRVFYIASETSNSKLLRIMSTHLQQRPLPETMQLLKKAETPMVH
jgi:hypothetical protein